VVSFWEGAVVTPMFELGASHLLDKHIST
jgi:hypothetical protein